MLLDIQRVRNVVLRPRESWPALAAENVTVSQLFTGWVLPLAAVPALAYLIAVELWLHVFMSTYAAFAALAAGASLTTAGIVANAVALYVITVGSVALYAWIVQILAPQFGAEGDYAAALKVVAYASTPYWLASILLILSMSALGVLVDLALLAAGIYGIYILYEGLGEAMHTPREKRAVYTVVIVVVALVVSFVTSRIIALP